MPVFQYPVEKEKKKKKGSCKVLWAKVQTQQQVGDHLSICVLNILPKFSSLCDLMWPHVGLLIKGSCLGASYTKLVPSLVWSRYIFCRWRYVFYLSCDPTRSLRCHAYIYAWELLTACRHLEKFGDHRHCDSWAAKCFIKNTNLINTYCHQKIELNG